MGVRGAIVRGQSLGQGDRVQNRHGIVRCQLEPARLVHIAHYIDQLGLGDRHHIARLHHDVVFGRFQVQQRVQRQLG